MTDMPTNDPYRDFLIAETTDAEQEPTWLLVERAFECGREYGQSASAAPMGDIGKLVARLRDAQNSDVTLDLTIGNCGDLGLAIDAILSLSAQVEQMKQTDHKGRPMTYWGGMEAISPAAPAMECDAAFIAKYGAIPDPSSYTNGPAYADDKCAWCYRQEGWNEAWQHLSAGKR